MDGSWFELSNSKKAPWMVFAEQEYETYKGVNENTSPLKEKIIEYHKTTTLGKTHYCTDNEWNHKQAWCASFVNWCFEQTEDFKKTNSSKDPSYNSLAFDWTPKNWENGEKCEAFIGAVITLKYSHTAFIVGKNSKKNKYVYLGGNQGSKTPGKQQTRYGTVTIGKEKSISKHKNYKISKEEKVLTEMNVNADGSLDQHVNNFFRMNYTLKIFFALAILSSSCNERMKERNIVDKAEISETDIQKQTTNCIVVEDLEDIKEILKVLKEKCETGSNIPFLSENFGNPFPCESYLEAYEASSDPEFNLDTKRKDCKKTSVDFNYIFTIIDDGEEYHSEKSFILYLKKDSKNKLLIESFGVAG